MLQVRFDGVFTSFAICMLRCYRYDLLLADEATPFEVQTNLDLLLFAFFPL